MIFAEYIEHDPRHAVPDLPQARPSGLDRRGRPDDRQSRPHAAAFRRALLHVLVGDQRLCAARRMGGAFPHSRKVASIPPRRRYRAPCASPATGFMTRSSAKGQLPAGIASHRILRCRRCVARRELRDYFQSRTANGRCRASSLYLINRIGLSRARSGRHGAVELSPIMSSAEAFIRATPSPGPARIVQAGLYRNFGEEIP